MTLTYNLKTQKDVPTSLFEIARMKDGFLFDELIVRNAKFGNGYIEFDCIYVRGEARMEKLTPIHVTVEKFSRAKKDFPTPAEFVKSPVIEQLFGDGCRQYLEHQRGLEKDFAGDLAFLNELASTPGS